MSHEHQILASQTSGSSVPLPMPRVAINIRIGTMDDLPFIDSLQKMHTKMVGFMPTKALEGKVRAGHVLVAETKGLRTEDSGLSEDSLCVTQSSVLSPHHSVPVGYCIGNDQYFKRDDVGIIYQMNVLPGKQRGLIGATLVKAMFDRAAYGCRLFCCWCAQDIEANRFWESLGFVPLAFRAGSRGKGRVHIFWQRRIRAGDTTTPYWFPSQTSSGSIREDRLVLPIPPGMHWSDAKPIVLPGLSSTLRLRPEGSGVEGPQESAGITRSPGSHKVLSAERKRKHLPASPQNSALGTQHSIMAGGLKFGIPKEMALARKQKKNAGGTPTPRKKAKNDPRLIAAARELRDRWLEKVNKEGFALPAGKYEVSKTLSVVEGSRCQISEQPSLRVISCEAA